jgi:hypothetical protein
MANSRKRYFTDIEITSEFFEKFIGEITQNPVRATKACASRSVAVTAESAMFV